MARVAGVRLRVSARVAWVAIGRVAANWSLLEVVSGLVLMGLVGSRDETLARAVVAGQLVENVWDTTEALLVAYGDTASERLDEFRGWRRSANACRRRRNEAIHSAWSLTESSENPAAWDMMSQKAKRGARTDLLEREIGGLPGHGNQVTLDLSPFEIATLRLERAGATSTS